MSITKEQDHTLCEHGVIVAIEDGVATIEADTNAGCASCKAQGHCAVGDTSKKRVLKASVSESHKVGDSVSFAVTAPLFRVSFAFYLLPALGLMLGAVLGSSYIALFSDTDLNSIVGALLGLALSIPFVMLILRAVSKKSQLTATIVHQ